MAAQGYNPVPGFMDFQFGAPYAVAVDTALNVFVADPYNNQEMAVSSDLAPPGDAPGLSGSALKVATCAAVIGVNVER